MNLPNLLTLLRIFLIPIFVVVFYLPGQYSYLAAAFIFFIASITDWLDGYLARSLAQTSKLGAFLDPVADKLIVATALVLLVGHKELPYLEIPAAIIVGREIVVSALREWMAELGKRASMAVSLVGKLKTAVQMIAIILLLLYRPEAFLIGMLGYIALWLAALLTLWSMVLYLRVAWRYLTLSEKII